MKLQQYSGPVHAKGVEDTAYYRYNVLASLNEVGGDPAAGHGVAPGVARRQRAPSAGVAPRDDRHEPPTTPSEARTIGPGWTRCRSSRTSGAKAVGTWTRINALHRALVEGHPAPARNDEYLFYQALLGAWPPDTASATGAVPAGLVARLTGFMTKAVREAKVHSSWVNPNQAYEHAVEAFVAGVLASPTTPRFLAAFLPLQREVAVAGMINSLAQLTLKIAAPGVADFYQGTELWDLSLVDPDNRRLVDYDLRRSFLLELQPLLGELAEPLPHSDAGGPTLGERVSELLASWPDGRVKLYLTARGLRLRHANPELFLHGDYVPLEADDVGKGHLIALMRRYGRHELVAVVPRLTRALMPPGLDVPVGASVWGTSRIPLPDDCRSAVYVDAITGETVKARALSGRVALSAAEVLRSSPVALLLRHAVITSRPATAAVPSGVDAPPRSGAIEHA